MPTFPFFIPMMLVLLPLVAGPVFLSIYLIENHRRCVYWYKIFIVVYFSFFYVAVIFATLVYWIPFILFFGGSLCLGSLIYGLSLGCEGVGSCFGMVFGDSQNGDSADSTN